MIRSSRMYQSVGALFPIIASALFVLPILFGLLGTWLPAFGFLPSINSVTFSLEAFDQLYQHPSTSTSLKVTLQSAFISTCFAFVISQWLSVQLYSTRAWRWLTQSIAPLLALPHLAFGVGFAFIISPSGWLVRMISPAVTGFNLPPDWLILNDPQALSLTLALILKEIPFFLLMTLSAMSGLSVDKTLCLGRTLGYSHREAWFKLVFSQMYPQLRLPIFAVLSYSLSVVDMSLILGPNTPPTFAVLINRWFNDADTSYRLMGAAGASVLFVIVLLGLCSLLLLEKGVRLSLKNWLLAGPQDKARSRGKPIAVLAGLSKQVPILLLFLLNSFALLSLLSLIVWSFSLRWRFPDFLPEQWSMKYWSKAWEQLPDALWVTGGIAFIATIIATALSIAVLEIQGRSKAELEGALGRSEVLGRSSGKLGQRALWLIYLPMLIPQVSFLFGIQVIFVYGHIDGTWFGLVWGHLIFVIPYSYLTLQHVYRQFNPKYFQLGLMLSQSKWRSFFYVKLPMLLKPISFTLATGFAVSVSQYLPTIYLGAGRFQTVTTETVNLATGSDVRILSAFALWQFLLPLLVYSMAILIPLYIFRHRKGL